MSEQEQPGKWLSETAKGLGVILDHVDQNAMPNRLTELYILAVFTHLVEFVEAVREEHPNSPEWKRNKDEHSIDFLLRNLGMLNNSTCKNDREVVEYYRFVRNRLMHPDVKMAKLENQRKQVHELLVVEDSKAPHQYGKLDYNDFDLFTRRVKLLAERVCVLGRPKDTQIASMLNNYGDLGFRKFRRNRVRFDNSVCQQLRMTYNLARDEAEPISKILFEALA
jgi:hypothetical protein